MQEEEEEELEIEMLETVVTVDEKGRCTFEAPTISSSVIDENLLGKQEKLNNTDQASLDHSSKTSEQNEMEKISHKRKADSPTMGTDTENAIKKVKLEQETCEAIITVTEKGKCSFEMVEERDSQVKGLHSDESAVTKVSHIETSLSQDTILDPCLISVDLGNHENCDNDKTVLCNTEEVMCLDDTSSGVGLDQPVTEVKRLESVDSSGSNSDPGLGTSISEETESAMELPDTSQYVALDCEFVGVIKHTPEGVKMDISALGRCSIVDYDGNILCDIYANPKDPICRLRTKWSGITKAHMKMAIPADKALSRISEIIKGKIVVGHALKNDFDVLGIEHPVKQRRDTSLYRPFLLKFATGSSVSLKTLASNILGISIQKGSHCSVVDARTTMNVFKSVREIWEKSLTMGQLDIAEPLFPSKKKKKKSSKKKSTNPNNINNSNKCDNVVRQHSAEKTCNQTGHESGQRQQSKTCNSGSMTKSRGGPQGSGHSNRYDDYNSYWHYHGYGSHYEYTNGPLNSGCHNPGYMGYGYRGRAHPRSYGHPYNNYFEDQFWPDF